jgi:hypothetical protein
VFQRYSTLNAISSGCRGHPGTRLQHRLVPAFGYDLTDYGELFEEKVKFFAELMRADRSPGKARPARRCTTKMWCHT